MIGRSMLLRFVFLFRRISLPIVTGLLGACAQPAVLPEPADCNAAPDPARPQYIVGYGSLMDDESRGRTSPAAGPAQPVELHGYTRGWFSKGRTTGFSTTFLGIVADPRGSLNAVVYEVQPAEVMATDRRESSYCRVSVEPWQLRLLGQGSAYAEDAQTWVYLSPPRNVVPPSERYPIVQSYVDIFLTGCFQQEERFHLEGFAKQCVATTADWSAHWVNDRIYPRRPFIYQPRARQIDELLSTRLPQYFSRIRIEGGR